MSGPVRIQLKRTRGWRLPENTVKVDRTTVFGNPCVCSRPSGCPYDPGFDRSDWENDAGEITPLRCCVDVYRHYVTTGLESKATTTGRLWFALEAGASYPHRQKLIAALPRLKGKNLACWCKPDQPCHADVLLEIANKK